MTQEQFEFDSCGALDLSSASSSIKLSDEDTESNSDNGEVIEGIRKRKAEVLVEFLSKRKKIRNNDELRTAVLHKRRNIRDVLDDRMLEDTTREAKSLEDERLQRLQDSGEMARSSSDSDESKPLSDVTDDDEEEDPHNSGMHVDDGLNTRDSKGRVLVNINHPTSEPDIHLAPQLAHHVKPHQIGGVRFLYDNVVESVERFSHSPGFGCILAHNMGLGKTMQVISFIDIFLSHTSARSVLCIVPINTLQNWLAEFNHWLPAEGGQSNLLADGVEVKHRDFNIYVLNDNFKNVEQRASVIKDWGHSGGVLLMGYELYRQLSNKKSRKKKGKYQTVGDCEEKRDSSALHDIHKYLVSPGPDLVICDEGHRIKNSHASISQALKQIRTKRRVVLTGYPLQNNLIEYWCMVDFVRPNYLGNKTEFCNMFERPIQNGQCIDSTPKDVRLMKHRAHVLHQQLKGFVQRRGHIVLKNSLPNKTEHVLFVRMTDIQRKLYSRFMEELITNRCVSNPLKAFAVCCKIWNHPDVLYNFLLKKEEVDLDLEPEEAMPLSPGYSKTNHKDQSEIPFGKKEEINYDWTKGMFADYKPGMESTSNKLQIFMGILEESVRSNDRILLFSQSLFTLNLIEDFLKRKKLTDAEDPWVAGVNYYRLDGSTSALEREKLINNFNANRKVKLFLVSTRAGSLGVNLVGANRVIIFDASWNPCHDTQAVCRVYRYGQTKNTHVYRLVTDNSLEKKIYDRQINKQGMADRIVDELNPDAHLSSREVHSLICDEFEDPECVQMDEKADLYEDEVIKSVIRRFGPQLTKPPFAHESLLVDRKDNKLSAAEKKLAEKSYKMERTSKITYSRPSYAAFYPKHGSFATNLNNPGSNGYTRNRYYENGKKRNTWLPAPSRDIQADPSQHVESAFPVPSFSNVLSPCPPASLNIPSSSDWRQKDPERSKPELSKLTSQLTSQLTSLADNFSSCSSSGPPSYSSNQALQALSKQGVSLNQVVVPRDLSIPTGPSTPPVCLQAGDKVVVIKTAKGIYLKMGEKIIKIKQPQAVVGLLGVPDA